MHRSVLDRGKLHGRQIDLDESVEGLEGDVEVFLRPAAGNRNSGADLLDVVSGLPAGTRSKEDMDAQLVDERSGWPARG